MMTTRFQYKLPKNGNDIAVESEDCNLIIISDLHLSEGYIKSRYAYSRAEHFFSDEAFANFLRKLQAENESTGRPLKLIINGDFLDFVRAKSVPDEKERRVFLRYFRRLGLRNQQENFEIQPHEFLYGLKTEQYKSVWKLHRICQGHPLVFEALAEFVANGNRLVIIKGNHDLEFYWPAVRAELTRLLAANLPPANGYPRSVKDRYELINGRVEFCQRAYIIEDQVYIEHGHQYHRMTRVDRALLNDRELRLPPGSIFNRYLVNAIEHLAPFVTRVRGEFSVLRTLIASHRWRALRLLMRHFPVATRMLLRGHRRFAFVLLFGLLPYLFATVYAGLAIFLPAIWDSYARALVSATGKYGEFLIHRWFLNAAFCIGIFGILKFIAHLLGHNLDFHLQDAFEHARSHLRQVQEKARRFMVLGHTHDPEVRPLGGNWWYVNTGTWVPNLDHSERHPFSGKRTFTFASFVRKPNGTFDFDLRYWNDDKGRSERLIVWE